MIRYIITDWKYIIKDWNVILLVIRNLFYHVYNHDDRGI